MSTTTEELLAAARRFREAKARATEVVDQLEAGAAKDKAVPGSAPDLFPMILGSLSTVAELGRAKNALLEAALKEPTA